MTENTMTAIEKIMVVIISFLGVLALIFIISKGRENIEEERKLEREFIEQMKALGIEDDRNALAKDIGPRTSEYLRWKQRSIKNMETIAENPNVAIHIITLDGKDYVVAVTKSFIGATAVSVTPKE